jgi:excisionase family DNA binding protein
MAEDRVPLFVRLPRAQASALDDLAGTTGRRKQELVSELLGDQLAVGRIELVRSASAGTEEVLTLEEAAALLRAPVDAIRAAAAAGELPARQLAGEWRFSRAALLAWLAAGRGQQEQTGSTPAQRR